MSTVDTNYLQMDDHETNDFNRRTKAISQREDAQWPLAQPLAEAMRLAEHPLKIAAYRVATGAHDRALAEAVGDIHHTAANGATMTRSQINRYLDLLIPAYSEAE